MDDLNGKCVNVVLAIEMGRGLSFLESPVKIIANFHGRPLESDLVKQEDSPVFNTELVWEIEKKELRKVRTTNSPLRVEVQTCDDNHKKDRVGFILLSTRSANIIPYDFQSEIPFKWYKLLGVPAEHKRCRPELFLSLTIRDLALGDEDETPYLTDITVEETELPQQEALLPDGKSISLCYLPNGYIQIGSEECTEKYLLTIVIQVAYNLDLLLPEILLPTANRSKYFISFNMFGITIKSKPFCRDLHANIPMNEKIIVRIVSEYQTIRMYLTHHCQIVISFYCGADQLGMTKLNVQSLLENVTESEFKETGSSVWCEQKCYFKFPSPHGIVPTGHNERQPFIEVSTTLKQFDSPQLLSEAPSYQSLEYVAEPGDESGAGSEQSIPVGNDEGTSESYEEALLEVKSSMEQNFQKACGDEEPDYNQCIDEEVHRKQEVEEVVPNQIVTAFGDHENELLHLELNDVPLAKIEKKVQSVQNLTARSETVSESCKSVDTALKHVPPLMSVTGNRKIENVSANYLTYQQYCLDVILDNISLKKIIQSTELYIKFKHPKAASENVIAISTDNRIGEDILLENTRCKMFFISTKDNIRKMVYAWPPKLVLANDNGQNISEDLDIYTAMFLSKERFECSYITECKALRTYEPLAKISITMYLQEYGLCAVPEKSNFMLQPPILDEYITIEEMQELQTWKDNQKTQYAADLKILQKQRLTAIQENWKTKKTQMEEKLNQSIQKCQSLSIELQTAINNLRTKKAIELKEQEIKMMPNCSFKDLLDKNNLKYNDYTPSQLIPIISRLERDNDHLKKIIDDQRAEVDQIKKTALTKEQTTSLLQQLRGLEEKFEEAQKAKTYFKEQWKKAVREIHDLKAEDQKQIQERIQNQKIELSQLSLENFIGDHNSVRSFDFAPGAYPVSSQSTFGAFKWDDNSVPFDCSKNS